ncbi:hypothetical protein BGZ73_000666 [Actinomortierella ambigua]|nr:hypothetical protein BGZ73_000666 [Actinomortierella ambigua]
MRTIELIQLLRQNEHATNRLMHLEQLGQRGVLHVLGELCNWLQSEFAKYQRRQQGPDAPEDQSQATLRNDALRTIRAIQFVLAFIDKEPAPPTSSPVITEPPSKKAKIVLHKEEIMDSIVKAMASGCRPLGPKADSSKIQLACAKTLRHCLNPATKHPPFPQEALVQRLLQLSDQSSTADNDAPLNPLEAIAHLLDSTIPKLQDYGLQLLMSHRSILQNNIVWQVLPAIHTMLSQFRVDLTERDDQVALQNVKHDSQTAPVHEPPVDQVQADLQVSVYISALTVLQRILKDFCKESTTRSHYSESAVEPGGANPSTFATKLSRIEDTVPIELVWDLWTLVQHVLILGQTNMPQRDKLLTATTANVYWYSWCLPARSIPYLINQGSSTLMSWYALYITEHSGDLEARKGSGSTPSTVLEFLTKLILQTLMVPEYQPLLQEGDRPLVLTIARRTIEFLEEIPSQLDTMTMDTEANGILGPSTVKELTYPSRMLRARHGLLDSTLSVLHRSFLLCKEKTRTIPQTRLLESLIFILSTIDDILPHGSTSPTTEAHSKRCLLEMLQLLLQSSSHIRLDEVTRDMWERSSQQLVDWMMWPVEQEACDDNGDEKGEEDEVGEDATMTEMQARLPPSKQQDLKQSSVSDVALALQSARLFRVLWLHLSPSFRSIFANRLGPRIFQLYNIRPLLSTSRQSSSIPATPSTPSSTTAATATIQDHNDTRRREMLSVLLDIIAHFGNESSVRIHMRDHWGALVFLETMMGASLRSLAQSQFACDHTQDRMVIHKVLAALRQFWFDQRGLERLVGIHVDVLQHEMGIRLDRMISLWPEGTLPASTTTIATNDSQGGQVSVIPLLLKILLPPRLETSYQLLFRYQDMKDTLGWHPLYEQYDPLLVDASVLLKQLCQLSQCQHYLVAHPGVLWCLSRMMLDRSLTEHYKLQREKAQAANEEGAPPLDESDHVAGSQAADPASAPTATSPPSTGCSSPQSPRLGRLDELSSLTVPSNGAKTASLSFEQVLFQIFSKLMSSQMVVKAFINNNTVTEIFGAVVVMQDRSLFAPNTHLKPSTMSPVGSVEAKVKGNAEEEGERDVTDEAAISLLFPSAEQQAFLEQLLTHFKEAVEKTRWQFHTIYQFVGGQSALDLDQQVEAVFWRREYAAVALFYMMKEWPPEFSVEPSSVHTRQGSMEVVDEDDGSKPARPMDDLLGLETVYGDICRMLTLEMEYEEEEEKVEEEEEKKVEEEEEIEMEAVKEKATTALNSGPTEAAQDPTLDWRRFSAATALQTKSWQHASAWQALFQQWRRRVSTFAANELQEPPGTRLHSTPSSLPSMDSASASHVKSITFLIGDQRLLFPDRAVLARSSPFFASLLEGAYREAEMDEIQMYDVDLTGFEIMLELIKESQWTRHYLLPPDLALENVLKLLVYAERFQVPIVKRLAEAWVAETLILQARRRHGHCTTDDEREVDEDGDHSLFEDTLVKTYAVCSSLAYGSFHEPTHPFYDLLWNTLRLMLLHLGAVSVRPGFRQLWEDDIAIGSDIHVPSVDRPQQPPVPDIGGALGVGFGGQDKIQAFLQAVTKLIRVG